MRTLVTGHQGYIGATLCPILSNAGMEVVGLDTGYFEECVFYGSPANPRNIKKDIRDVAPEDLEGIDGIVHLAALSNDPLGDLKNGWTEDINHHGTMRLAEMAKTAGVKRFVYASSCSMYGTSGIEGAVDESAPLNPLTSYAVSKVRCEEGLSRLADDTFSPAYMRNATAFGLSERVRLDIVVNNLTAWAVTTKKIRIMSDGSPWRPLVHIEDISKAALALLEAPREKMHDQAFNIGLNSENFRVREIAEIVADVVPGCELEITGEAGADQRSYRVSFDKFDTTFPDANMGRTVRSGVEELYKAYTSEKMSYADFDGPRYIRLKQLQKLLDEQNLDGDLRWA